MTSTAFLALVFAAELAAWAAIGYAAYVLVGGGWQGAAAALLAVVVATVAWGRLASPKARAPAMAAATTKVVTFGGATLLLVLVDRPGWALALAALVVLAHAGARLTDRSGASRVRP